MLEGKFADAAEQKASGQIHDQRTHGKRGTSAMLHQASESVTRKRT